MVEQTLLQRKMVEKAFIERYPEYAPNYVRKVVQQAITSGALVPIEDRLEWGKHRVKLFTRESVEAWLNSIA